LSGVLTVDEREIGGLRIGNTAWTNYSVLAGFAAYRNNATVTIGVRVKDLNNYIAIECDSREVCAWIVVYEGVPNRLVEGIRIYPTNMILTAEGDIFSVTSSSGSSEPRTTQLILPPRFQGKLPSGGVMVLLRSESDLDFIEIQPFP
jgi:hypothetical protein